MILELDASVDEALFGAAEEGVLPDAGILVAAGDGAALLEVAGGGRLAFCDDVTGFAGGLLGVEPGMGLPGAASEALLGVEVGGALLRFGVEDLRGVRVVLLLDGGCERVRDGVVEPLAPGKTGGGVLEGILTDTKRPN